MKHLDDCQVARFDTEYVNEALWQVIKARIDKDFPEGDFTFLDLGGGSGRFADRLLANYPRCTGTVLDNSELLLRRNTPRARKTLIRESVENIGRVVSSKYDLICLNWLLHHLVGNSYRESRNNMSLVLRAAVPLLTASGRISIFENMYRGFLLDNLPSHLIFLLTSSKSIAAITRKLGANTGGVGVCFLSEKQWRATIKQVNLEVLSYTENRKWSMPWLWPILLHVGSIRVGHFWLAPSRRM